MFGLNSLTLCCILLHQLDPSTWRVRETDRKYNSTTKRSKRSPREIMSSQATFINNLASFSIDHIFNFGMGSSLSVLMFCILFRR
jgi:hypothetical protein